MSLSRNTLNTLIAGAFAVTMVGAVSPAALAEGMDKEKCYGVVKAGHNDCKSMNKSHSCAGHSTVNGGGGDFVALPKGVCEKLVGGSTTPTDAKGTESSN
jgi:uncharacterized membrane protein